MTKRIRFPLRVKMSITVTVMALVLCIVSVIMSNGRFSSTNEELFKQQAYDLAQTAALTVDGDALKAVSEKVHQIFMSIPEDEVVLSDDWGSDAFNAQLEKFSPVTQMPEYKKVLKELKQTQDLNISTLSSVYTSVYDENSTMCYSLYLVDAAPEDPCFPGVFDHVEGVEWKSAAEMNLTQEPYLTNTDMYGWLVTSAVPVYTSNGEIAGQLSIDLDMNDIKANETKFSTILTITLAVITLLSIVITLIIIGITVVKPVRKLSEAAEDYISDDEDKIKFSSIEIRNSDEIGDLSDAMRKMESDIETYVDNITKMTAEKERITAELSIAAKMQADILPRVFPKREDIELFATMTPAKEMGGDFYDLFIIDDDHIGLVMADVSGKGVPAAMFMIVAKTLLKIRASAPGTPSEMFKDVNNTLCADNPGQLFVTAWFGIFTLSTGELISANAGHEYPAVMHEGGEYELIENEHFPPLAAMEDMEFEDIVTQLRAGDRIFLYTDGVPEAKAPDGSRFGTNRMLDVLNSTKNTDPHSLLDTMKREIYSFTSTNDLFDDVTMMSVVWHGKQDKQ